jgi:transcriptional regulator with XRE-family HTH domain
MLLPSLGQEAIGRIEQGFDDGHALSMGKHFPLCQLAPRGTLSTPDSPECVMVKKPTPRPLPRFVVRDNLKLLMDQGDIAPGALAVNAGIDRKTLNNFLNARYDPRPEMLDKVAAVFGLDGWMLLSPLVKEGSKQSVRINRLLTAYAAANEKGKENVLRVAEMAAEYKAS